MFQIYFECYKLFQPTLLDKRKSQTFHCTFQLKMIFYLFIKLRNSRSLRTLINCYNYKLFTNDQILLLQKYLRKIPNSDLCLVSPLSLSCHSAIFANNLSNLTKEQIKKALER